MQLKRQSEEAWQNEKHYSKGNNTNENPIPRLEISNQSTMWSTKVRSGHNICCLCNFLLELSSCRVTYENCYKSSVFFNHVWDEWMDLRNSNDFESRKFYFTSVWKLFRKFSSEVGKCIMHARRAEEGLKSRQVNYVNISITVIALCIHNAKAYHVIILINCGVDKCRHMPDKFHYCLFWWRHRTGPNMEVKIIFQNLPVLVT